MFSAAQTSRMQLGLLRLFILALNIYWYSASESSIWFAAVMAFYGLMGVWAFVKDHPDPTQILLSLMVDVLAISIFLYFNQGIMSGWGAVLMLPPLFACLLLNRAQAWLLTLLVLVCHSVLSGLSVADLSQMSGVHHGHTMHQATEHGPQEMARHIQSMWLTFVVSLAVLTGFISQQRHRINLFQQQNLSYQERFYNNQRLLAFANLTANTSHQLGTPLSSAKMLLEEIQEQQLDPKAVQHNVSQAQTQLDRCTSILKSMVAKSESSVQYQTTTVDLTSWLNSILDEWSGAHPDMPLQRDFSGLPQRVGIQVSEGLKFAFSNLLDNCYQANREQQAELLLIKCETEQQRVTIKILHHGEKPDSTVVEILGKAFVPDSDGLGLGAVLAQSAIEHVAGTMHYSWSSSAAVPHEIVITLPVQNDSVFDATTC